MQVDQGRTKLLRRKLAEAAVLEYLAARSRRQAADRRYWGDDVLALIREAAP